MALFHLTINDCVRYSSKKSSLAKSMDLNQRKLCEITISYSSHTIVTSVGYQSFMSNLEKEICSENISEYLQIKNVLKIEMHDVMQDILSKHLQLFKLDVELPNDAHNHKLPKKCMNLYYKIVCVMVAVKMMYN